MPESPYARIIETVRKKCIIFAEALQIGSQKHQQNLPENCSKSTEMAITVGQISKISREACPRTRLKSFLLL